MTDKSTPEEGRDENAELNAAITAADATDETIPEEGADAGATTGLGDDGSIADGQRQAMLHSGTAEYYEIDDATYLETLGDLGAREAIDRSFTGTRDRETLEERANLEQATGLEPAAAPSRGTAASIDAGLVVGTNRDVIPTAAAPSAGGTADPAPDPIKANGARPLPPGGQIGDQADDIDSETEPDQDALPSDVITDSVQTDDFDETVAERPAETDGSSVAPAVDDDPSDVAGPATSSPAPTASTPVAAPTATPLPEPSTTGPDSAPGGDGSDAAGEPETGQGSGPVLPATQNEAPDGLTFEASLTVENDPGAVVGTVSASDTDGGSLTWTVDDDRFEVVDGHVALREGVALDHETDPRVELTLTVTDEGGLQATQKVQIDVQDLNEAPEGIAFEPVALAENDAGAQVGTVSAIDPDGNAVTWNVDDDRFEIVDGRLTLRDGEALDHEADPTIGLTLTATDDGGLQTSRTVRIDVQDMNEAPDALSFDAQVVAENDAGAVVGTVSATDPEGGALTWTVDDPRFEIVGTEVRLRDGIALDHEVDPNVELMLTATDEGGLRTSQTVSIDVSDLDEAPLAPSFDAQSVVENDDGAVLGSVSADDPEGADLTWTVDDTRFEVVDGALKLREGETLDHEAEPAVTLTLTATDPGGNQTQSIISVDVGDINEVPDGLSFVATPLSENDAGAVLGTVSSIDPEGDELTWTVDDARFEVVDGALKLRDGEALNHEAEPTLDLTISATDPDGLSTSRTLRVDVADLNEAPEGLTLDIVTIHENAPGARIGTVSAEDPESGPLTWTVDDARFQVVGDNLELRDGIALDHEMDPFVDLVLTATDAEGAQTSQTFRIDVADLNETPEALSFDAHVVAENGAGAVIGTVSAIDPEGGALTWTVDDPRFEIVGTEVRLRDGAALDYEAEPSLDLILTATDDGGLQTSRTVQIDVQDVNEAPDALSFDAQVVAENDAGAVVGTVSATDPEGSALTWTVDDPRFEVVGTEVRLRDGAALDYEAEPSLDLTLTATDEGGLQTSQTVQIDVQDVNEAPDALSFDAQVVAENDAGAVVGTVSANDPEGGALTWTVDDARFEVVGTEVRLRDGAALDYEVDPNVDLTLTATDEGGLSTIQAVSIAVQDEITTPPDVTVGAVFHVRQIGVVDTVTDLVGVDWGSDPIGETFVSRVDLSRTSDGLTDLDGLDAFATLVTGHIDADVAGTYDLRVPGSDTSLLWVDGELVAIDVEPGSLGLAEVSIHLTEGPHEVVIQHLDLLGDGALRFEWRPPGETAFDLAPPATDHIVEEGDELGLPLTIDTHDMDLTSVIIEDVPANWLVSDGTQTASSSGADLDVTTWDLARLSVSPALGDVGTTTITLRTTTTSPSGEPATARLDVEIDVHSEDGFAIAEVDIAAALAAEGIDLSVSVSVDPLAGVADDDPDDGLLDPPPDSGDPLIGVTLTL